jgi:hypothetical protein
MPVLCFIATTMSTLTNFHHHLVYPLEHAFN